MTDAVGQALEQALAYHRAPARLSAAQGRPLPEGMLTLLRLAGGDQALAAQCAESCGESEPDVVAAAVFFIQQVMFANGSDSYRVLGVNPDAPDARIKEHYRWLVRWLHPDRNTDDWDSVYADRVNAAWQTLRLPERRRDYDQGRSSAAADDFGDLDAGHALARSGAARPRREAAPETAMLSGRTVQRLPVIVLGGLGGLAVTLLLLMWLARDQDPVRAPEVAGPLLPAEARPVPVEVVAPPAAADAAPAPAAVAAPTMPDAVAMPEPAPMPEPAVMPEPELASTEPTPPPAPLPVAPPAPTPLPKPREAPPAARPAAPALVVATARASEPAPRRPTPAPRPVAEPLPAKAPAPAPAPDVLAVRTAPPPAPAVAAPSAPAQSRLPDAPQAITEPQARVLLGRFSQAYRRGDINGLMRLFAADARNNRGGRDAIVYDYQSLFSSTDARDLRLTPSGWMPREGGATLLANYEASVQLAGRDNTTVTRGEIRFDLRLENGEPRISVVRHDAGR